MSKGGFPEGKGMHFAQLNMREGCVGACLVPVNTSAYFDLQGCQASFLLSLNNEFIVDVVVWWALHWGEITETSNSWTLYTKEH